MPDRADDPGFPGFPAGTLRFARVTIRPGRLARLWRWLLRRKTSIDVTYVFESEPIKKGTPDA